jgi:hypothetical protein
MTVEKKEKKEKKPEEVTVPFLVYLKAFFLLFAVVFGMFILNKVAKSKQQTQKKSEPSLIFSSTKKLVNGLTKENIQNGIQEEIRTNETYKNAVKTLDKGTDQVLGEASKAAETVIDESKDTIKNTVYEYTVEKMIMGLIDSLPENSKKRIEVNVCK